MLVHTSEIELSTTGESEVVDITARVRAVVRGSNILDGIGCVFVPGATGGLTTMEFEPGCILDFQALLERLAPAGADYEHEKRWGDGNGHSHLRAALIGPSLSFPINSGEPTLGAWQSMVFVDFDNRARDRRLIVKIVGAADVSSPT